MIFIFPDGQQVHKLIGTDIHGMLRAGQRPVDVLIGAKELQYLLHHEGKDEAVSYLVTSVFKCLDYPPHRDLKQRPPL